MNLTKQILVVISIALALKYEDYLLFTQATRDIVVPKFSEWQVTVINDLAAEKTLFIHCKSKEDDLGEHNLQAEESFTWSFRQNVIHTTLFWCYMSKDDVHAKLNVFWNDVILFHRCGWKNCVWIAKDDAVYLKNSATGSDLLFEKWEIGL